MAKTLVVYYSQSRGNTKKIAREIASTLGADLAAIDTVRPYNCSYDQLVYGLSKTETQTRSARPSSPWTRTRQTMTALCWAPPPGGTPWPRLCALS